MVYLIHFDTPYKHAMHYLGFTEHETVDQRLERHRRGNGANLLKVLNEVGISYRVVRVWPMGDRNLERRMKSSGHARRCPVCNPNLKKFLHEPENPLYLNSIEVQL